MLKEEFDFLREKNILISGITGFVGSWLAEIICINQPKCNIYGLKRKTSSLEKISHIKNKINFIDGDMLDKASLERALKVSAPNFLFHLAAQASIAKALESPIETFNVDATGTLNLLETVRRHGNDLEAFHFASSGSIYGIVDEKELPIRETHPIKPTDIYATSKATADLLCYSYFGSYNTPIIRTRAFHHEGPRCREDMIGAKIAKEVVTASKEKKKELIFGNIEVVRDFSDVRDIVRGYILAVKRGKKGEVYNLCSGKGYKIKDLIEKALDFVGLRGKVSIVSRPKFFRKGEASSLIGDFSKAKKELGWKPTIPFEQTLKDMIDYYSKRTVRIYKKHLLLSV